MKQWGGRFERPTDELVEAFSASIAVDARLAPYDIAGAIAHARELGRCGLLTPDDVARLIAALEQVRDEFARGAIPLDPALEDVHTHVEARLRELVGELADKLHTGRSRNDQVALDVRLYVRDALAGLVTRLVAVQEALLALARRYPTAIVPGYTHLQRAQPVLFAHHLLAYVEMLERDIARAREAYARANVSPLGSGALAGVPYPLDRERVAAELGMSGVTANSIDATADRDFAIEAVFVTALVMQHLSRLSEEIVIWSSAEFGFLQLDDAFTTGSSIMPQKKNPDVAELVRGKTGRVYGALMSLLTLLKGLPLAYNRDLQEDKVAVFDAFDTTYACLDVMARMLGGVALDTARARAAAGGLALATELADYLAKRGVPFRQAHRIVGGIVRWCLDEGRDLERLTATELRRFSEHFGSDAPAVLSAEAAVAARDVLGGTAPHQVNAALAAAADRITRSRAWLASLGA